MARLQSTFLSAADTDTVAVWGGSPPPVVPYLLVLDELQPDDCVAVSEVVKPLPAGCVGVLAFPFRVEVV